ncbi:MAG: carbohydrate ABC transporter permease [Clostridia bacterium]|nr:carbohydrate ABC transporter permease [Clostridia bacterium]
MLKTKNINKSSLLKTGDTFVKRAPGIILKIGLYILLFDLVYTFLYPFIYMLVTSIKSPEDVLDVTVNWIPNKIYVKNYSISWEVLDYPRRFLNSALVTLLATVGHVFSCAYVGYGFARYEFIGKKVAFILLLLLIIVPAQTIIIPRYLIYGALGISATNVPLWLPTFFGYGLQGGLFIFIFRQFFLSLPKSLEEAASIDGCGPLGTFFKIALPSSRSSIMVVLVLSMVWHWNDYYEPSIYIDAQDKFLLPMMLPNLYSLMDGISDVGADAGEAVANVFTEGTAMAATTLTVLPIFIAYMFLQKQFVQGIERSGITGE